MNIPPSNADSSPTQASVGWRALVLLAAGIPFAYMVDRFRFLIDDSYITFRYSKNFAEGNGLVYNLGVDPPVEGYSEFLWTILLSLGIRLGWDPEWLSQALSISAGALMIFMVTDIATRWLHGRPVALIGTAILLGSAPPLGVWATGGMATMAAATLGVALFWCLERLARRARPQDAADGAPSAREGGVFSSALALSVCASLLALMRADAALMVALLLGPVILVGLIQRNRLLWKPALVASAVSATVFGAHVAWRYSVYGDWLPNTARVKIGFSARALERGMDYALSNACSMPGLGVAFVGGLLGAALCIRRQGLAMAATIASMVVGVTTYAVTAGGDFMPFARFLVPAIPFAVLGLGVCIAMVEARTKVLAALLVAGTIGTSVVAAHGIQLMPKEVRDQFHFRLNKPLTQEGQPLSEYEEWSIMKTLAEKRARVGRALSKYVQPGESMVAGAIGSIGYYSGLFIYDRYGLVTREVALRHKPKRALRSPGHDKVVPRSYFEKDYPTYMSAGVCSELEMQKNRKAVQLGPTDESGMVVWVVRGPKR